MGKDYVWERCTRGGIVEVVKADYPEKELLEVLKVDLNLMYISDIPRVKDSNRLIESVRKQNAKDYPSEQWKDLLLYVLKTS